MLQIDSAAAAGANGCKLPTVYYPEVQTTPSANWVEKGRSEALTSNFAGLPLGLSESADEHPSPVEPAFPWAAGTSGSPRAAPALPAAW